MPSTFSTRLRLELQATGENRSTWGVKANNDFSLIDTAIAGYTTVSVPNADVTLTALNGADDQSRYMTIEFTGTLTANRTITFPSVEKFYALRNNTTGGFQLILKASPSGVTRTLDAGANGVFTTNGTDFHHAYNSAGSLTTGTLSDNRLPTSMTGKTFTSPATFQGTTTFQSNVALNPFNYATGGEAIRIAPSDFGTNKPGIIISKAAGLSNWNIFLWDGSTSGGTLNLTAEFVQANGSNITTVSSVGTHYSTLGYNAVGSTIMAAAVTSPANTTYDNGSTISGSNLRVSSSAPGNFVGSSGTLTGTWYCLGAASSDPTFANAKCVTTWRKIA